jgi:hypothetical protein
MQSWIVVTHHVDRAMCSSTHNQEPSNPNVVRKDGKLSRVVCGNVRIRRHRVHVVSHDDAQRTHQSKVNCQLGVPRRGQGFVETFVTFSSEGTFVVL